MTLGIVEDLVQLTDGHWPGIDSIALSTVFKDVGYHIGDAMNISDGDRVIDWKLTISGFGASMRRIYENIIKDFHNIITFIKRLSRYVSEA